MLAIALVSLVLMLTSMDDMTCVAPVGDVEREQRSMESAPYLGDEHGVL